MAYNCHTFQNVDFFFFSFLFWPRDEVKQAIETRLNRKLEAGELDVRIFRFDY